MQTCTVTKDRLAIKRPASAPVPSHSPPSQKPARQEPSTGIYAESFLLVTTFVFVVSFLVRVYSWHAHRRPVEKWEYEIFPFVDLMQQLAQAPSVLYFHIVTGAVPLLIGPFQLWKQSRLRFLPWHKRLGTGYLAFGLVMSAPTLYMSWRFLLRPAAKVLVFLFGCAFIYSIWQTYHYITKPCKDVQQHQQWALRSYLYILVIVLFARGVGTAIYMTQAVPQEDVATYMIYVTSAAFVPLTEPVVKACCPEGYRFLGLPSRDTANAARAAST